MKKLSELYEGYEDILVKDIKINSKEVEPGDIFVCTMGVTADRHDYIEDAISHGASAVVVSKDITCSVPTIRVEDTNQELPLLASKFYDFPEKDLKIIAVTGTNGKTTVAETIQHLLGKEKCGYLGTNGIISSKFEESIRNTTPDSDRLYKYFRRFVDAGCKYLCMETSSEAYFRNRLDHLQFETGILTNITEDHLNIHKTIENYVSCKKQMLKQVKEAGYCILNTEDTYFEECFALCHNHVLTYGKKEDATLQIISYCLKDSKTEIMLKYQGKTYEIESPLLGEFNVYNLCAALLGAVSIGENFSDLLPRISNIKTPRGRFQFLDFGQPYKIVLDYAHTPDAFSKIYPSLNSMKQGRLITVTGSAGGRETEKRGPMGKIVLENSDFVIFTMDDPRNESVDSI
ncbi:MAG: UDP-N-acetylmuramoyl-L-alanyl-D-glutamate--2,6-diaminopimelate ligase, partial [Bacilli bacterium]|nr:UDP-N-acetylmuramoyl-L-alanyl-D-glutamate--2,6-diaminopimelate ligase [Bacilli bacterium]